MCTAGEEEGCSRIFDHQAQFMGKGILYIVVSSFFQQALIGIRSISISGNIAEQKKVFIDLGCLVYIHELIQFCDLRINTDITVSFFSAVEGVVVSGGILMQIDSGGVVYLCKRQDSSAMVIVTMAEDHGIDSGERDTQFFGIFKNSC